MHNARLNQKGVTIIELLAVIVLLTIVLTLAFSAYKFGVNAYQRANEQSELQDNVRIASHVTTEKLRFASDVTLLASCPSTYAAGFSYICVNANGRSVEQYIYNGSSAHNTVVMVAENLSSPVTYGIEFNKVNNYRLSYTIKGHKNSRNFEVKSQVSLLNMELKKQAIIIGGTTAFKAIAYKVTP